MRYIRYINVMLLVVLFAVAAVDHAMAQTESRPAEVQITLVEAIEQALARNRDLAVSRREIDIGRGRLQQARRYPFNPELGLEGDVGRGVGREDSVRRGTGGGKVGLSQVVEIRGQRSLRVRAAEAALARAEWAAKDAERDVIAETTKAVSELLLGQERLNLSREALTLATGLRDTARELVDAGEVPEVDLLRAEVEVRRATNRVRLDESARRATVRNLALLIGAPADVALSARGPLLLEPVPGSSGELVARARAGRPDVRATDAAVEAAQASLELTRAERFVPSVTLSASYGEALEFDSRNQTVLLGLSVPLPLWNRRDGDVQAAEAEVRKQQAERDRMLARLEKEVRTAFAQFDAARQVLDEHVRQIVPAQEQNAQIIQEGYRLGQFRLTEVLLAQRDLVDTRTGYLEAIASYNAARIDLQKAAGAMP